MDVLDYHLKISLTIPRTELADYDARSREILGGFKEVTGFDLMLACRTKDASGPDCEVFHIWDIKVPEDVPKAMCKLADFPSYMKLDRNLVKKAVQEIVYLPPGLGVISDSGRRASYVTHSRGPTQYLRSTEMLRKNYLDGLLAAHQEGLREFEATSGLRLLVGVINITGVLNELVRVWEVLDPELLLRGGVDHLIGTTPGHEFVEEGTVDLMEGMAYNPAWMERGSGGAQ